MPVLPRKSLALSLYSWEVSGYDEGRLPVIWRQLLTNQIHQRTSVLLPPAYPFTISPGPASDVCRGNKVGAVRQLENVARRGDNRNTPLHQKARTNLYNSSKPTLTIQRNGRQRGDVSGSNPLGDSAADTTCSAENNAVSNDEKVQVGIKLLQPSTAMPSTTTSGGFMRVSRNLFAAHIPLIGEPSRATGETRAASIRQQTERLGERVQIDGQEDQDHGRRGLQPRF